MTVFYGFLGAILALSIFAAGVFAGWRGYDFMRKKNAAIAEQELGEEERRRLASEQEAFRAMLNYNAERAYADAPMNGLQKEEVE